MRLPKISAIVLSAELREYRMPHPSYGAKSCRHRYRTRLSLVVIGGAGDPFAFQCAAARGSSKYEVLALPSERTIQFQQKRRAARYSLPIPTASPANTTPAIKGRMGFTPIKPRLSVFFSTAQAAAFLWQDKEKRGLENPCTGYRCKKGAASGRSYRMQCRQCGSRLQLTSAL